MNIIKIENLEYKTYQKLINVTLFNELIDLMKYIIKLSGTIELIVLIF